MPHKPRPIRKPSISASATPNAEKGAASAVLNNGKDMTVMPPPPNPPAPLAILEPEISALSECLRNATVKTGQIFRFYSDAQRLAIHRHAPNPPRALTSALTYEVGRYDQLCDAMESQLLRAISVLQRDLEREETRLKEAEKAALAKDRALSPTTTRGLMLPPGDIDMAGPLTGDTSQDGIEGAQFITPPPLSMPMRRQSKISLSNLRRSPFPLKLDLSSSALRLGLDEVGMAMTGLASPVTLAPRSARPLAPNELPPDLMAALAASASAAEAEQHVEIDLTMGDTSVDTSVMLGDHDLGSSAAKPIELDLDSMDLDLFGDATNEGSESALGGDGLFTPSNTTPPMVMTDMAAPSTQDNNNMLLEALSAAEAAQDTADLLASFNAEAEPPPQPTIPDSHLTVTGANTSVPSPSSILASLGEVSHGANADGNMGGTDGQSSTAGLMRDATVSSFDYGGLDMSDMPNFNVSPGFFSNGGGENDDIMEQLQIWDMGGIVADSGDAAGTASGAMAEAQTNINDTSG